MAHAKVPPDATILPTVNAVMAIRQTVGAVRSNARCAMVRAENSPSARMRKRACSQRTACALTTVISRALVFGDELGL